MERKFVPKCLTNVRILDVQSNLFLRKELVVEVTLQLTVSQYVKVSSPLWDLTR
jgi:hypothetical protein